MSIDTPDIRPVFDHTSCDQVRLLGKRVWGSNDEAVAPTPLLITLAKNGGVLLAAYLPDGPDELDGMVGFVLGYPGYGMDVNNILTPKHCSHQIAVLPGYQRRGIGLQLKLAQREAILSQGVTDWVTWTFDPLQRVNAIFNLTRLGATSHTYISDAYGHLDDDLNTRRTSDRLQVDWRLSSQRVVKAITLQNPDYHYLPNKLHVIPQPYPDANIKIDLPSSVEDTSVAIPIPMKINNNSKSERLLLSQWGHLFRSTLTLAFDEGYKLTGCSKLENMGWHYILSPNYPG